MPLIRARNYCGLFLTWVDQYVGFMWPRWQLEVIFLGILCVAVVFFFLKKCVCLVSLPTLRTCQRPIDWFISKEVIKWFHKQGSYSIQRTTFGIPPDVNAISSLALIIKLLFQQKMLHMCDSLSQSSLNIHICIKGVNTFNTDTKLA